MLNNNKLLPVDQPITPTDKQPALIGNKQPAQIGAPQPQTTTPTISDFASEAKKLGLESFAAVQTLEGQRLKKEGEQLSGRLFGQNVGGAAIGQNIVKNALLESQQRLEPIAQKTAADIALNAIGTEQRLRERTDDRNAAKATNLIGLISSGEYTPSSEDLDYLKTQGYSGTIVNQPDLKMKMEYGTKEDGTAFTSIAEANEYWNARGFNTTLAQEYGSNPTTNAPFQSKAEAADYWASKGFDREITQNYGIDPSTGKPFNSVREADAYAENQGWDVNMLHKYGKNPDTGKPYESDAEAVSALNLNEFQADIARKYGVKGDGTPFASLVEAEEYKNKKEFDFKYGKKENGDSYSSEAEALADLDTKGYDTKLVEKYGMREKADGSLVPFGSQIEAEQYWLGKGADMDIMKKYGMGENGMPFKSEKEAIDYTNDKQLKDLLKSVPEGIAANINSLDEFNYFIDKGVTYEDEIADILSTNEGIEDWKSSIPSLTKYARDLDEMIRKEESKGGGFFGIGGSDPYKIDDWEATKATIEDIINQVNNGINPLITNSEIEEIRKGGAPQSLTAPKKSPTYIKGVKQNG